MNWYAIIHPIKWFARKNYLLGYYEGREIGFYEGRYKAINDMKVFWPRLTA